MVKSGFVVEEAIAYFPLLFTASMLFDHPILEFLLIVNSSILIEASLVFKQNCF
jgi:hypothetical protein